MVTIGFEYRPKVTLEGSTPLPAASASVLGDVLDDLVEHVGIRYLESAFGVAASIAHDKQSRTYLVVTGAREEYR